MNDEWIIEYYDNPEPVFTLMDEMYVEKGTKEDYLELHHLHYKVEDTPAGPTFWACRDGNDELVGVVVMATCNLLLGSRHKVFPKLKPGQDTKFTNVHRGKWLNANMRRASRIITDTLYRGVGISYRMVNIASRMQQKRFIEIQSSMSKFNPFTTKAGFKQAKLEHARNYEKGMEFFRGLYHSHPADHQAIVEEHNRLPAELQAKYDRELRDWYYKNSSREKTGGSLGVGMRRVDSLSFPHVLREAQQLVFASPVYGIWENPDLGRELPDRIPLSAFDLQGPNEPLRLDLL